MMNAKQSIPHPTGVTAFGSAVIKEQPDFAVISCAVSRIDDAPDKSFSETRKGLKSVLNVLQNAEISDFGTSRISLVQKHKYVSGEHIFAGYEAAAKIVVTITELDKVEEVACALVEAGANEIENISFGTSRLKALRLEARRMAVEASREKAENYCRAAQVKLGKVIHIEDVNPDTMNGTRESHNRSAGEESDIGAGSFDPSAIQVNAAVIVAFAFEDA